MNRLPHPVRILVDWLLTIGIAVAVVLAVKAWVVNPYRIPSASMEPTLHCARPAFDCEGARSDRVLVNRVAATSSSSTRPRRRASAAARASTSSG